MKVISTENAIIYGSISQRTSLSHHKYRLRLNEASFVLRSVMAYLTEATSTIYGTHIAFGEIIDNRNEIFTVCNNKAIP